MTVKIKNERAYIYLRGEFLIDVPKEKMNETIFRLIVELGL